MSEENPGNVEKVKKVPSSKYKIFNDPVHGKIRLHPLLVHIIDTPQFQRLRNIKQLGAVYYVYPGASHNRFEHCIGTCHLAGLLVRHLQKQLDEEGQLTGITISEKDVLCVEIAALCHDLGHGPFSHAFENNFIKKFYQHKDWTHEKMSINLFEHMISNNEALNKAWTEEYGMTDGDKRFILKLINPPDNYREESGFNRNKAFLYEIVSNKMTCIDVDKFDYFARDALYLGLRSNFDHMRYIYGARVLRDREGNTRICCRETDLESLYDLFHTRHLLHRRAYQHKNAKIIEEMIIEAFVKADETKFFSCPKKEVLHVDDTSVHLGDGIPPAQLEANGAVATAVETDRKMKLSDTVKDPEAYTYVTDHVFHQILCSTDDSGLMETAREILNRVNRRDLYACIGVAYVAKGEEKTKQELDALQGELKTCLATACNQSEDQVIVTLINMNYGKGKHDPLENQTFYRKAKKNELVVADANSAVSEMIKPKIFMEQRIVAYCKDKSKTNVCKAAFKTWCTTQNYRMLMDV